MAQRVTMATITMPNQRETIFEIGRICFFKEKSHDLLEGDHGLGINNFGLLNFKLHRQVVEYTYGTAILLAWLPFVGIRFNYPDGFFIAI
jgi:hypothetical protein